MTSEQKRAHEKLQQSLPTTTHFKIWPEKKGNVPKSLAASREAGRKGRLAAVKVGGY